MFDDLQKAHTRKIFEKKLIQAPKGLARLYATIIQRFSESLDEDELLLCRKVLQWVITTKEQLTVNQLAVALAIQDGQRALDKADMMPEPEKCILTVCAPLVEVVDDAVRIVHLSVKDFLLDASRTDGQNEFLLSRDSLNADVGISLLTLLSFDEFAAENTSFDSQSLIEGQNQSFDTHPSSPRVLDEADDQSDDEDKNLQASRLLQYGLDNWHHHCIESEAAENAYRLYQLVCNYLTSDNSFLWIPSLFRSKVGWDWVHAENQLLDWRRNLNVGKETPLRKGFLHQIVCRRLAYFEKHLNSTDPRLVAAIADLGKSWHTQNRLKEAEELYLRVLEINKKTLRQEHRSALTIMNNLALVYQDQCRWNEAETLHTQVLETRKRALGQEHLQTLATMDDLASATRAQGRLKEAEELHMQVLDIGKRVFGQEHPYILFCMSNLACTYKRQGRWKEAEELLIHSLEASKRVLGKNHPYTLTDMEILEGIYEYQGRWKEAEELNTQVFAIKKRYFGLEDPRTLESMYYMAKTWKSIGRDQDAIALMREAQKGQRESLGVDHPDTTYSTHWLEEWRTESALAAPVVAIFISAWRTKVRRRWEEKMFAKNDVVQMRRGRRGLHIRKGRVLLKYRVCVWCWNEVVTYRIVQAWMFPASWYIRARRGKHSGAGAGAGEGKGEGESGSERSALLRSRVRMEKQFFLECDKGDGTCF